MIEGTTEETVSDEALGPRPSAKLRPKKRSRSNKLVLIEESALLSPAMSDLPRHQRIKKSGRAQLRWRITPEICTPAPKTSRALIVEGFLGLFGQTSSAAVRPDETHQLDEQRG